MRAVTERGDWPAMSEAAIDPASFEAVPLIRAPRSVTALDALHRARHLWEQSQPQYVLFDPYDVLRAEAEGADPAASPLGLCSEDAAAPSLTPSDGSRIDPLCGPGSREHAGHTAGFGPTASSTEQDARTYILERATTGGISECWEWQLNDAIGGYGVAAKRFRWIGGLQAGSKPRAHRLACRTFIGPIPDTYVIHHTCWNKLCVNPAHLEALPPSEHSQIHGAEAKLRTHCPKGHEYTPENSWVAPSVPGTRRCRICRSEQRRAYYWARKAST